MFGSQVGLSVVLELTELEDDELSEDDDSELDEFSDELDDVACSEEELTDEELDEDDFSTELLFEVFDELFDTLTVVDDFDVFEESLF